MLDRSPRPHSPRVDLARSVSSTRTINPASDLGSSICPFLAMSQLYSAVRAPPTCKLPVGEGANLKRGGASEGFLPARGNVATVFDSSVVENKRIFLRKAILEDFVTNAFVTMRKSDVENGVSGELGCGAESFHVYPTQFVPDRKTRFQLVRPVVI
jgi:hypothetical protein